MNNYTTEYKENKPDMASTVSTRIKAGAFISFQKKLLRKERKTSISMSQTRVLYIQATNMLPIVPLVSKYTQNL